MERIRAVAVFRAFILFHPQGERNTRSQVASVHFPRETQRIQEPSGKLELAGLVSSVRRFLLVLLITVLLSLSVMLFFFFSFLLCQPIFNFTYLLVFLLPCNKLAEIVLRKRYKCFCSLLDSKLTVNYLITRLNLLSPLISTFIVTNFSQLIFRAGRNSFLDYLKSSSVL